MGVTGTAHQEAQRLGPDLDSASSFTLSYGILDLGGWLARVPEERPGKLSSIHKALWLAQGEARRDVVSAESIQVGRMDRMNLETKRGGIAVDIAWICTVFAMCMRGFALGPSLCR